MLSFEWDPEKSKKNKTKHGIDFEESCKLWNDPHLVQIGSLQDLPIERRFLMIGQIHDKVWTAIVTLRGNRIRLISVRRSRKNAENIYHGSQKNNHH